HCLAHRPGTLLLFRAREAHSTGVIPLVNAFLAILFHCEEAMLPASSVSGAFYAVSLACQPSSYR
ncbi:hypothetical protein, partial [Halopseudomonas bauzanensis]|uniref:hypothetical protein n=1 Tax=Halopseudomonas bauzanensis TaxID=653930 RepID=UPI002552A027